MANRRSEYCIHEGITKQRKTNCILCTASSQITSSLKHLKTQAKQQNSQQLMPRKATETKNKAVNL